jgi:hypothetical protein
MTGNYDNIRPLTTLAELYPHVRRITLFIAFEEADSESEPNYQQIIFTAEDEANFRLDCSREACVAGGFDLAPVVDGMVKNREERVQGRLACAGTLGADGNRCLLHAEYRIVID